jgi:serine/threonine protein kinase
MGTFEYERAASAAKQDRGLEEPIPERDDGPDTAALTPVTAGARPPGGQSPSPDGWVLAGRYRVVARIGSGGMADVFRAHDDVLGRDVAVKVFRSTVDDRDTAGVQRREMELRALARLNHPNLITLFDASMTDAPAYLVMELVEGPTLADRINAGALPEPEVCRIGVQIADALAYVHGQGMVHRDVKPANVLLGMQDGDSSDGPGRARLSDFGIVRLLGSERLTSADLTLGTASYLAPEQARGGDVQPSADIYSLALVLLEALTGTRTFDGPAMEAIVARLSGPPHIPQDLPGPWTSLLAAMTAMNPIERPPAAVVARILRGEPVSAAYPVAAAAAAALPAGVASADAPTSALRAAALGAGSAPARRRVRRAPVLATLLLFGLLAGGAALVFGIGHGTSPADGGQPTKAGVSTPTRAHATSPAAVVAPASPVKSSTRPHTSSAVPRTSTSRPAPTRTSAAPPPVAPTRPAITPVTTPADTTSSTASSTSTTAPSSATETPGTPSPTTP